MTVPAPTSSECERRLCRTCDGVALDIVKDQPAQCSCDCHKKGRR